MTVRKGFWMLRQRSRASPVVTVDGWTTLIAKLWTGETTCAYVKKTGCNPRLRAPSTAMRHAQAFGRDVVSATYPPMTILCSPSSWPSTPAAAAVPRSLDRSRRTHLPRQIPVLDLSDQSKISWISVSVRTMDVMEMFQRHSHPRARMQIWVCVANSLMIGLLPCSHRFCPKKI